MQARTMNPKAVVAAAMMMMAVVAVGMAGPASAESGMPVPTRTLMQYGMGAWTAPAAVVLRSASEWQSWNDAMVARGAADGAEAMPAGVDWANEAVLVVTLGQNLNADYSLAVTGATRVHGTTVVALSVTPYEGGVSPCVVVALDRSLATNVVLQGVALAPAVSQTYAAALAQTAGAPAGMSRSATWGELKYAYKE